MKIKSLFTRQDAVKYLRELSIVVAGIAITFTVAGWIDRVKEKNDTQNYLDAVKLELQENLANTKDYHDFYKRNSQFSKYLINTKKEDYSNDSITKYRDCISNVGNFLYKNSAFEMLKISGAMRLMDQKVLKSIWRSYDFLEDTKQSSTSYMDIKLDILYSTILSGDIVDEISVDYLTAPENKKLFLFFRTWTDIGSNFYHTEKVIKETLSLL